MNIVLFGAPGAGKGTQSASLVLHRGMLQVSTGDLLRAAMKNCTELGLKAKSFVDKGELVPDNLMIELVEQTIKGEEKNFILDGFPRTVVQAEALNSMLKKLDFSLGKAIFLEVPFEVLFERLTGRRVCKRCGAVYHVKNRPSKTGGTCDLCGGDLEQRKDDSPDVIGTRLKAYQDFTEPLKDFYRHQNKYAEINGNQNPNVIFEKICEILGEF